MAATPTFLSSLPPTPPPHVYSQVPIRSQSPQISMPPNASHGTNTPNFRANTKLAASKPVSRKMTSFTSSGISFQGIVEPMAPSPPARVWSPKEKSAAGPFSPSLPSPVSAISPRNLTSKSSAPVFQQPRTYDNYSQAPQDLDAPQGLFKSSRSKLERTQPPSHDPGTLSHEEDIRHISTSTVDHGLQSENNQPLQYYHQSLEEMDMRAIDKRTSKLTMRSNHSEGSVHSEPNMRSEQPFLSDLRNSVYGRDLNRPDSGFSSTSDLRGRTRSPQIALNSYRRTTSAHSVSPEIRPYSNIDLLNIPYPQPPPSGAENLVNAQLRTAVGTNASLLSTRQTLEMYRVNVKKTNDPAIQYEFAVFMISAAQEGNLEEEDMSVSAFSDNSQGSVQSSLLKEARQILQRLSDRSYPFAQYYLADGYASGLFNKGKEDYDRAFPLFLAASKHGHAEAGYRTALCYEFGWGCRVDAAKAVQFYQHAASKNHPGAMLRLGRACLMGDMGLSKRYREGIRWLKRGAESADFQYNSAPYELGLLHETGYGDDIFQDETYAAQLFTKSADLGHAEANYRLGDAYEQGRLNCPKDPALSIHFYTGAAQQGHPLAQMALCAWYLIGAEPVLEKDEGEAYEWAKRAAESGLAKAEYTVGYFTEMGIGCRRDPLEANVWYVQAADQGDERAKHRIQAIRAAATGANPATATSGKKGALGPSKSAGNVGPDGEKMKKKFGIF